MQKLQEVAIILHRPWAPHRRDKRKTLKTTAHSLRAEPKLRVRTAGKLSLRVALSFKILGCSF